MYNYSNNKESSFNSASYYSKKIDEHGKKSPVEDKDIIIIVATPEISRSFQQLAEKYKFTKHIVLVK